MSELLSGATIALPTQVITILSILQLSSQLMFGFFLTAAVLTFCLVFLSPLTVRSRWVSLPLAILSFIVMALVLVASAIGSAISVAFKYAAEAQSDLNIRAEVGVKMFVFMWLATGFSIWAFAVHAGMGCCCVSRRDVRTGRRTVKGGLVQRREVSPG
jgi:CBS domain containing-hemolysin-like protein